MYYDAVMIIEHRTKEEYVRTPGQWEFEASGCMGRG